MEDALDLDRERLRFEEERMFAVELYKGMGLSEKVSLGLYTHGIFLASQVVTATDNELRNAGVPAAKMANSEKLLLKLLLLNYKKLLLQNVQLLKLKKQKRKRL